MRKLVVTRGLPGSGKSYSLKALSLDQWTLSADSIRMLIAAPELTTDGRLITNQRASEHAFELLNKYSEERMSRGETLAIDTTMATPNNLSNLLKTAESYRYEICILDMTTIPFDVAMSRNDQRSEFDRVPERRMQQMHEALNAYDIRNFIKDEDTVIYGKVDNTHVTELDSWLREPVHNFSNQYLGVVHIGDLQGCFNVLAGDSGPLENGFNDDFKYVFVGDLLDRGIENGKVLRWFVDHALHRDNVTLLWGNHEDHLHRWAREQEAISGEFALRTLPQLIEAGITRSDAEAVCRKAREFLHYEFNDAEVIVTHAGLSTFPERPHLLSLQQLSHGTGRWEDPVDEQFERNSKRGFQVHGHRNHGNVAVRATTHSFNLEDSVEHGGNLRICTLDNQGWSVNEYKNRVFRPLKERLALETRMSPQRKQARKMLPHWIVNPDSKTTTMDSDLLQAMQEHKGVRAKASERFPHVYSLNFTKKVFHDRSWDDVVVKARGLFINENDNKIVSRGYDKFWNIGERPDTELSALETTLKFPVTMYVKYNGFLGNMGYDETSDRLFLASKSTPDGMFADYFQKIVDDTLTPVQVEKIRRYLRDTDSSMTWEVIDPVNDPHMIEYSEPKIVLLDIIRRSSHFEKASYDVVKAVGKRFGLETKQIGMTFPNAKAFMGWYKKANENMDYKIGNEHVEGLIVEDSEGYMTKVKLPYYAFWKQMRSMKDRIVSTREKGGEFLWFHIRKPDGSEPKSEEVDLAHSFRDWCLLQDNETLKNDIISLRKSYEEHIELTPSASPKC